MKTRQSVADGIRIATIHSAGDGSCMRRRGIRAEALDRGGTNRGRDWEQFLDPDNADSLLYGVTDIEEGQGLILQKLGAMRDEYIPGGLYGTGNPLDIPP